MVAGDVFAADASARYSIVLESAPGTNPDWKPSESAALDGYTLYITNVLVNGAKWERLNLGFFNNYREASLFTNSVQKIYPGAWVNKVITNEQRRILKTGKEVNVIQPKPKTPVITSSTTSLSDKQLDSLMQRAKTDFKKKNYTQAIRYLTAIISAGEHKYTREALELLGVSRQRKGQTAHAVTIYKKYLEKYPTSDGSKRVKQRLSGLMTATQAPRDKIRLKSVERKERVTTLGSFSQFYRNDKSQTDDTDSITTLSQLITFLDIATIHETSNLNHRYQFTADDTFDFLDDKDGNEFRFIEVYYDLNHRSTGSSGRIGRQALRLGGLLKRFDGISAGYQFTPEMRINALTGYPVDIDNKTSINKNKTFYGLTFETGTFLEHWDMNLFYFDQKFDGLDDLTSTGTEVRYRDNSMALFGMFDYDLLFKELDILQFNANFLLDHGRTAYINAFKRKTPILATSSALIGRQEQTLEELLLIFNIEQIYQLARDRTSDSQTITIGGSQPLNERFQITSDITFSNVGETVASGGVPATPGTGTDYFLSAQLVGNNLLMNRDTGVLGIRYLNTDPSKTTSFIVNTRYPITRNWRINPRLQYDIRKLSDGRSQNKLRVLLRTDYRYLNKIRYDFEVGYDDTSEEINGQSLGNSNLFFTMGYRWDF
jgi:tetratricopeptide (TPR) repeat protein